jgi:hypothetical protein
MYRTFSTNFVVALLLTAMAFAQSQSGDSLGDLARANRAKQQAQEAAGTMPKVITNQDLPADPPGVLEASASEPMTMVSGVTRSDHFADQRLNNRQLAEQRSGKQWKAQIQNQENRIEDLQARIDRLNAFIRTSGGTAQYETPVNRYQAIQMQRLAMMQEMEAQQRRRLEMMQDAARRSGMNQ